MDRFSGFEPQVGEIRALRTFRIGPGGRLYPLFGKQVWTEGVNTAQCRVVDTGRRDVTDHRVVDPACTCGFYAYADEQSAAEYPHARHVLAVVACWGRVVAGTRGIRAEHARVEAIWMSETVPADLAAAVQANYPALQLYSDRAEMLAEHPPSQLDCYEQSTPRDRKNTRIGVTVALVATLILGLLPWHWITGHPEALGLWCTAVFVFAVATIKYGARVDVAARKKALVCSAAVLWLVATVAGPAGFYFFRLPVLQFALFARRQRRTALRESSRFPADIR
jgi:hypothetical protein